jgi:phospholipid-transporting ATPase
MSWQDNEHSLLDLDDPSPHPNRPIQPPPHQSSLSNDPFASNRPSTSYDDFAGQGSSTSHRPYPLTQSTSNISLGTMGTASGTYSQYPEDGYNDDHEIFGRNTQRSRHSKRESGSSVIGGFIGRVTGGRIGAKHPDMSDMDLPLTQTGVPPAGMQHPGQPSTSGPLPASAVEDGGSEHSNDSSRWKFSNFHFGRAPVDPSTLGPRMIHVNDPPANNAQKFMDNHVSTAKYNIATFLPKFLYEQFSKYANLFFLFTAIIQQVPNVSPTNQYTTIGPLAVVLLVSAIKEAIEDVKRHNSDKDLNRSKAEVLQGGDFVVKKWYQIKVGDIIRVISGKPIPADLILLASSEPEGLCYIETANLDGETNLKIKQALPETAGILSPGVLSRVQGVLKSEQPNNHLYTYEGTLTIDTGGGEKEIPLSPDQMLLRVISL